MARGRRVVEGQLVVPWRDDPRVVRITAQILARHARVTATLTAAVVEIGRRMSQVRDRLEHGQWGEWIAELPIDAKTVARYMAVAEFADQAPAQFRRFAQLSPSKLYILAAAPRDEVTALRLDRKLAIGDGRRKKIGDMTARELGRVVGGLTTTRPTPKPIGTLVQSAKKKTADFEVLVDELVSRADELDDGVADDLAEQLRALADRLDAVD